MNIKNISAFCLSIFLFILFFSCPNQVKTESKPIIIPGIIENASWLIGKWENISNDGNGFESWVKINDSLYSGESYFIKGKDTLSTEFIKLEQLLGALYYIPTVSNQNGSQPVSFKLSSYDKDHLIFENPSHDFPQKITYSQINSDSLLAEISGMYKGIPRVEKFPMRRGR